MKSRFSIFACALVLAACSSVSAHDQDFLALKANPPTSVNAADLVKLEAGQVACNVFNSGTSREYQTCWFPSGKPTQTVLLYFYKPIVRGGVVPNDKFITSIKL